MILRNFDFASKYLDYELMREFENSLGPSINGWYKFLENQLTALIVKDNNIFFLYGNKEILITKSHRALIEKVNIDESTFFLLNRDNILIKFNYKHPDLKFKYPPPFDYIDPKDFNWGEFIANIINNEEKKKNYIFNLMNQN